MLFLLKIEQMAHNNLIATQLFETAYRIPNGIYAVRDQCSKYIVIVSLARKISVTVQNRENLKRI